MTADISFHDLLVHSIFHNKRYININFLFPWMKNHKFVLVKFGDNLFALSQVTIFASSLLAIETRWSVVLWEQHLFVSLANNKY